MGRGGYYLGSYASDVAATAAVPPSWTLPIGAYYKNTGSGYIVRWNGVAWYTVGGGAGDIPAKAASLYDEALTGLPTVDGVGFAAGERILLTRQTNPIENGVWAVAVGAWSRPTDFLPGVEASCVTFIVAYGDQLANTRFLCTSSPGSDVVDTDGLALYRLDGDQWVLPPRVTDFPTLRDPWSHGTAGIQGQGALYLEATTGADAQWVMLLQAVPVGASWTVTSRYRMPGYADGEITRAPMVLYNTAAAPDRFVAYAMPWSNASCFLGSQADGERGANPFVYNGGVFGGANDQYQRNLNSIDRRIWQWSSRTAWTRIYNDGVNLHFYASMDGRKWQEETGAIVANNSALVGGSIPDLIGWGVANTNNAYSNRTRRIVLDSWEVT
jgi:hypothetical protein